MFGWKTIENFLGQWYHVKRWRKFCAENNSGKKDFPAISPRRCVHVYIINKWVARAIWAFLKNLQEQIKDVRAHCYCASLVRTLFIGHARVTSFSSARTDSKTQQNIERMTFALTWCANIFVGCSVTPTFLIRQITSFSDSFHHTKK